MSIRENIHQVIDLIKPEHILVSVFDKNGLDELVKGILEVNPDGKILFNRRDRKEDNRDIRSSSQKKLCLC